MATEKWIAGSGQGLTWGDAFTAANLNSLGSGNALAGNAITNGTPLDIFADISIQLGSAVWAAPFYIGVYLYPLNSDNSTYGDSRFGTSGTGPPGSNYFVGNIQLVQATQAQTGSIIGIRMPPGSFKFVIYNNGGVAFAGSANACQYRTYNRSIA